MVPLPLNNGKFELPFLRLLGAVESFLLEWQTCLVCSPQECSGVGAFAKAKELDAHALCWKWCSNVTEPVARYLLCSWGGHVPESRGNCSVQAEVLFDYADALKTRGRSPSGSRGSFSLNHPAPRACCAVHGRCWSKRWTLGVGEVEDATIGCCQMRWESGIENERTSRVRCARIGTLRSRRPADHVPCRCS
jgi:hypothetical protein